MSKLSDPIHLTRDEYRNITRCLENENFRKLFAEYCSELSDPENRKQYEKEIRLIESERGFDVKFIKPLPGYVIKEATNKENKIFINVCHSDLIEKPQSKAKRNECGLKGLELNIPYAQTQPRKDYDSRGNACMVYDVIFHHDTLLLAQQNTNFRKMLTDTAVDAVECSFNISLNKSNLKFPKLQYKGVPKMSVIRKQTFNSSNRKYFDENPDKGDVKNIEIRSHTKYEYVTPKFTLSYKQCIDYFEITNEPKYSDIKPDEIVIKIQLPYLNSASDCILNIAQNELHLVSHESVKYKLHVKLPLEVKEKNGFANFYTEEKILLISLPVIKTKQAELAAVNSNSKMSEIMIRPDCSSNVNKANTENRKIKIPKFSTNKMDNIFAFTINERNVDPESINIHKGTETVKCEFSSMSSGLFPTFYVFFVCFPNTSICDIEYEEWRNCLILKVILDKSQLDCYYVGLNENDLTEYSVMEYITDKKGNYGKQLEDDSLCIEVSKPAVKQERKLSHMSIEIKTKSNSDSEGIFINESVESRNKTDKNGEDNYQRGQELKKQKRHTRRNHKKRSLSESCCDQLKVNIYNHCLTKSHRFLRNGISLYHIQNIEGEGGTNVTSRLHCKPRYDKLWSGFSVTCTQKTNFDLVYYDHRTENRWYGVPWYKLK